MTIRLGVPADDAQMVLLWNQNVAPTKTYWPGGRVEPWTTADTDRLFQMPDRFGVYVSELTPGVLDGVFYVQIDPDYDQASAIVIRLDDVPTAKLQLKRWSTVGIGLVAFWAADAKARGVTATIADLPSILVQGKPLQFVQALSQYALPTSVTDRADYIRYTPTPDQLISALPKVV